MDNTNLFKHSPKELVTDGFITWLLYFLDSRDDLKEHKVKIFNSLFLKENDQNKNITSIKIEKQKKGTHGRPDLVLFFHLNGEERKILFENKTWTSTSYKQLDGYRKDYGDIYRYLYLKLAYINIKEEALCEECGYDIINSQKLYENIKELKYLHPIIEQYIDYLEYTFVNKIESLHKYLADDNFQILKNAQGQEMFMSHLYKALGDLKIPNLTFKTGSSAGRPWTHISICNTKVKYHEENTMKETVFWRVDIRSGKYYIRLNQYTYNPPVNYLKQKKERLEKLRKIVKELIESDKRLVAGKISNKGKAENEIVIFFEDNNSINYLLEALPLLSKQIVEKYELLT